MAYEFIDAIDLWRDYPLPIAAARWENELMDLLRKSSSSRFSERGQCDHCGARIRWACVLQHTSGDHIVVGQQCLSNRVGNYSQADFRLNFIRTHAANERARMEREAKIAAFVSANPSIASLLEFEGYNEFFSSLRYQLKRNGELSERQVAAYERSVQRDAERAAQRAADEAEHPSAPAPSGKVTVTGEVLSTKVQESVYGDTLKMLVRDDRGFKVWVTVPSAITVERGVRVTFSATLEVSDRDECFAFGKRPTKAAVL